MAKGVFLCRAGGPPGDFPEDRFRFSRADLDRARALAGDWIAYVDPSHLGSVTAIARVREIAADPGRAEWAVARIDPGSYLQAERAVAGPDLPGAEPGLVHVLSERAFARLLRDAFPSLPPTTLSGTEAARGPGLAEETLPFDPEPARTRTLRTVSRVARDRVFRAIVLDAYDRRCAITGLRFINGGGRAEVQAAHIKPVSAHGPDALANGIALSGTAHWMFDRGLIGLGDDFEILVSTQAEDPDQIHGLIHRSGRATVPERPEDRPHPRFLAWHRDFCFKG